MRKKVLVLANHDVGLYNFRKELLERLIDEGFEVIVSCPGGKNTTAIKNMGCTFLETPINRHGTNPINELKLIKKYYKIIKKIQPDIVFSYTIKPNVYGGLITRLLKIPFVPNVTGLGTAIHNAGVLQKIALFLYKISFSKAKTVFFQNANNQSIFIENGIAANKHKILPGSGVNLSRFKYLDYPIDNEKINIVYISRIMKDKGIEELLKASKFITGKYQSIEFHVCGFLDGDYEELIKTFDNNKTIVFHGMVDNISNLLKSMHCTVLPSYHEGMSNVLLESAASGRPVLASNIPGCRETFDEGISGFGFEPKNTQDLIETIEKFIQLTYEEKKEMGLAGRKKVEKEFSREIVIEKYLDEINDVLDRR